MIKRFVHLILIGGFSAAVLTGCLGGGGGGATTSQASLGTVTSKGFTVVSYDILNATLMAKGDLDVPLSTELNLINFYLDASCATTSIGQGIKRDFSVAGIEIVVPSSQISSIYVKTNTVSECYFFADYVPHYDAPAPPQLTLTSPASPTRATSSPYVVGSASSATTTVTLYSDAACTSVLASGSPTIFSTSGFQVTLTPDAISHIYARASDAFGKGSACTDIGTYEHSSTGPSIPTFVSILPVSPSGASLTPRLIGNVGVDASEVSVFSDAACTTLLASGTSGAFRTAGFDLAVTPDSTTSFYGRSTATNGIYSDCALLSVFVHDSVAPTPPVFVSSSPSSPTRLSLYPKIKGTASADTSAIKVYSDATCVTQIGSGARADFEGLGISSGILANTVTTLYAKSFDAAGNGSSCMVMTSYVNDSIPPDPPTFSSTTPASPNNQSTTPLVIGNGDITTIGLILYKDEFCTLQVGAGTADQFSSTGILATLTGNTITTIYARAADEAGNQSDCSALTNYAHSTVPATPPGFFQAVPASPTRITNKPYIVGTTIAATSSVQLFAENTCLNPLGGASRSVFTTAGIQVTLAPNANTDIYATARDVYGNDSPCTLLTSFIHNTVLPLDPIYVTLSPASPNSISIAPVINATIPFDPTNVLPVSNVSLYDNFLCLNRIGTGTKAQIEGVGLVADVPPNNITSIYARTSDAAGNMSNCTLFTNYIHDALLPGRPVLVSATPMTPSYTAVTQIIGSIGATTDFLPPISTVFYSDLGCTTQVVVGTPAQLTGAGIRTAMAINGTTTLYGANFNAVGTSSPCSLLINYVHSNVGPQNVSLMQSLDGSVGVNWSPDLTASPTPTYIVRRSLVSGGPYTTIATGVNGTSYIDSTVSNLATYYYVAAAQNNTGTSKNSAQSSITVNVGLPVGAASLSATPASSQVTLLWSGFPSNMTYRILRGTQSGGPYTTIASGLTASSYLNTGLVNAVSYYYVVVGTNPAGDSVQSNEANARPLVVPSPPTNLVVTAVNSATECSGNPGVAISWTPTSYYTNFQVLRGNTAFGGAPLVTTANSYYVDCNPNYYWAAINYNYYSIVAGWGAQQSNPTTQVAFANEAAAAVTLRPGLGHIFVSWSVPGNASLYNVERATVSGGPYTTVASATSSTTYYDNAVVNGTGYFYRVIALYGPGSAPGWPSAEQGAVPGANPAAPSNLIVSVNSFNQPVLSWTPSSFYNHFSVYRSSIPAGPYTFLAQANGSTFTDASPSLGINYYKITSHWGSFETAATNVVAFRNGVTSAISTSANASQVTVTWNAVAGGVFDYTLYRSLTSGGPYTPLLNTTSVSYADTTVVNGVGYFYVVRANFPDGTSGQNSAEASGARSTTVIPGGLTVTGTSPSTVTLAWARVTGATNYRLYRATSVAGTYTQVVQTPTTGGIATGLSGQTTYYFKVTAIIGGVEGARSTAVSGTTYGAPSAPIPTAGLNTVSLSWSFVSGITSYSVSRSLDGVTFAPLVSLLGAPSYIDGTALNGQIYFYKVTAVFPSTSIDSPSSVGVTPGIVPSAPAGLSITDNSTGTSVDIGWTAVTGATSYQIYSSTVSGGPYVLALVTGSNSGNVVSGLTPGTPTYFVVKTLQGSVESVYSSQIGIVPAVTPTAPTAVANGVNVDLTWTGVPGASTYTIYRALDRKTFLSIATGVATNSFSDTTAVAQQVYVYRFLPVQASGLAMAVSQTSAPVGIGVQPLAPASLTATTSTTNSVLLKWFNVPNNNGYIIYRSAVSGGPYSQVTTVSSVTTSYTNTGLTPGNTYFYVVVATNVFNVSSPYSNEVSISLVAPPAALSAMAVVNSTNLSWSAVGGATGYRVLRGELPGGPYGIIAANNVTTAFSDTTFKHGVTYYYVVAATVGGVSSPFSNEASATAIAAMNLQVPIELTDQGLSSDTMARTFERTRTSLSTSDYDGTVTYAFETNVSNTEAVPRTVTLVNSAGATVASLIVPGSTTALTRLRVAFTPTAGTNNYRVRMPLTASSDTLQVLSARILVNQINGTKTKIYFPLLASAAGSFTGDETAPVENSVQTSYVNLNSATLFKRETAKLMNLPTDNAWELETLVGTNGISTGAVGLYNVNSGQIVAGTETLFTSATPALVRSPFNEGITNFDSLNEGSHYQIALKCEADCDDGSAVLYKAGLWVRLTSLDKIQVLYRTSFGQNYSGPTLVNNERTLLDTALFSNPTTYFQVTGHVSAPDTAYVDLYTMGTSDTLSSGGSAVVGSSLGFISTDRTLMRSPSVSITAGHRLLPMVTPASATFHMIDSSILVEAQR